MSYDAELANRLRECVLAEVAEAGVSERRMFGGLAFLINGNLAVSASSQGGLLLRIDPARTESLTGRAHAEPFVMRGRELTGWLRIDPDGVRTQRELRRWVRIGLAYARSLPAKPR
jgi:TfoX/Sxy family transcriptional regulator of competence genes